ncbi:MAG: hypothetical protein QNJ51_18165 [Calothrix sp. MO_167.B12]|nr:hypothetical protein [Calothrix sp. MO_167.B12]
MLNPYGVVYLPENRCNSGSRSSFVRLPEHLISNRLRTLSGTIAFYSNPQLSGYTVITLTTLPKTAMSNG